MISQSVRDNLNLVGQSANLNQSAQDNGLGFPLSLRNWIKALPPGRIVRKVVPLEQFDSMAALCDQSRHRRTRWTTADDDYVWIASNRRRHANPPR